jgi:hypothetical protein
MAKLYKIVVHVPPDHADAVRRAIGDAGGGKAGDYSHCSFSMRGIGRFKSGNNANPHIGQPGEFTETEEEFIEVSHISGDILHDVVAAMEKAHPYEETAYQVFEMVDLESIQKR